jgi:hypothetical protein
MVDVDYFFEVDYRFFSIIFNDFNVDFDYFYNRDFDFLFAGPGLCMVSGAMYDMYVLINYQVTIEGHSITEKLPCFIFGCPLNTRALYVLQHRQHSA